ncbi:rhodanese-like domain-containing protein [Streptomyces sp. NPDC050145]|uniref:rhodanese-like domain-containing protein n=1 Tax=Streptomyces sp. NPDC050145 TaxID=3365602 RepID=UPI00378C32D9
MLSPFPDGAHRVTVEAAHRCTAGAEAPAVLLDVREQEEWDAGHAPWAVLAPLSALASGGALPAVATERPLVVICRSGRRSQHAVALLRERGAEAVDVMGGMQDWASSGHPVVDARGSDGSPA